MHTTYTKDEMLQQNHLLKLERYFARSNYACLSERIPGGFSHILISNSINSTAHILHFFHLNSQTLANPQTVHRLTPSSFPSSLSFHLFHLRRRQWTFNLKLQPRLISSRAKCLRQFSYESKFDKLHFFRGVVVGSNNNSMYIYVLA